MPEEIINMENVAESIIEQIRPGNIVKSEIVTIDRDYVYVNVGLKSDGRVSLEEFEQQPKIGDQIEVLLKSRRLLDGVYEFSKTAAENKKKWDFFLSWYQEEGKEKSFLGMIKAEIKSGKIIECQGMEAFLPFTLAADLKHKSPSDQKFEFYIKNIDEKKRSIIVSRQQFLEEKEKQVWDTFLANYKVNDVINGRVLKFVQFGAFVEVAGLDALLHRENLSWKTNAKIKEVLKLNEERDFVILNIDPEEKKISLGLKQLKDDPWLTAEDRYKVGDQVSGTVETIVKVGAFVEIEEGIDGFLHYSDLSWTKHSPEVKNFLTKGQKIELKILSVNQAERKINLGLKQLQDNPWDSITERFPVGSIHTKKIKNIVKFGLFVNLEEGIDCLINISNLSWQEDNESQLKDFKVGQEIDFKILGVNKEENKISGGIKQLHKSPWQIIKETYLPRQTVKGTVSKIVKFGLFVKLDEQVEGFIHISELSKNRIEDIEKDFKVGDSIEAIVLGVEIAKKKLSLSKKHHDLITEKKDVEEILKKSRPEAPPTLGDLLDFKLGEEPNGKD